MSRGYFGIGVYRPKHEVNVGTLWRHAHLYGASFIFTVGERFARAATDTCNAPAHVPMFTYADYADMRAHLPHDCGIVCVELDDRATALPRFRHPDRCVYLLGAEDHGLPADVMAGNEIVQVPAWSMNVSVAGTVVLYDRFVKAAR